MVSCFSAPRRGRVFRGRGLCFVVGDVCFVVEDTPARQRQTSPQLRVCRVRILGDPQRLVSHHVTALCYRVVRKTAPNRSIYLFIFIREIKYLKLSDVLSGFAERLRGFWRSVKLSKAVLARCLPYASWFYTSVRRCWKCPAQRLRSTVVVLTQWD